MIKCFSLNGELYLEGKVVEHFDCILESLNKNRTILKDIPIEVIIEILNEYGNKLRKNKEILAIEGVPYLSMWLKKGNLEKVLSTGFKDKRVLDEFVRVHNDKYVKAQPRGIVCHWISGNVPTLAIFSVVLSIMGKNCNIIRLSKESIFYIVKILNLFKGIDINYENKLYRSNDILKTMIFIYFDSEEKDLHRKMSLIADARVIWGGEIAVNTIATLDKKTTCKDVIFGPKYSFAIIDRETVESSLLDSYLEKLCRDVCAFNQNACSSPHVLFIEKSNIDKYEIAKRLSEFFKKNFNKYGINPIPEWMSSKIINKRGEYLLLPENQSICPKGLEYTILIDNEVRLEEPIGGKTIFIKEVENIFEIPKLITDRVQTVGLAVKDLEKKLKISDDLTFNGVCRVVEFGTMNFYECPWDGVYLVNELIRWSIVS